MYFCSYLAGSPMIKIQLYYPKKTANSIAWTGRCRECTIYKFEYLFKNRMLILLHTLFIYKYSRSTTSFPFCSHLLTPQLFAVSLVWCGHQPCLELLMTNPPNGRRGTLAPSPARKQYLVSLIALAPQLLLMLWVLVLLLLPPMLRTPPNWKRTHPTGMFHPLAIAVWISYLTTVS